MRWLCRIGGLRRLRKILLWLNAAGWTLGCFIGGINRWRIFMLLWRLLELLASSWRTLTCCRVWEPLGCGIMLNRRIIGRCR